MFMKKFDAEKNILTNLQGFYLAILGWLHQVNNGW